MQNLPSTISCISPAFRSKLFSSSPPPPPPPVLFTLPLDDQDDSTGPYRSKKLILVAKLRLTLVSVYFGTKAYRGFKFYLQLWLEHIVLKDLQKAFIKAFILCPKVITSSWNRPVQYKIQMFDLSGHNCIWDMTELLIANHAVFTWVLFC